MISHQKKMNFETDLKLVKTLKSHKSEVSSLLLLNNDNNDENASETTLISGSLDNTIKFWKSSSTDNFQLHTSLELDQKYAASGITCLLLINNTTLATGSRDDTIKLWHLERYTIIKIFTNFDKPFKHLKSNFIYEW